MLASRVSPARTPTPQHPLVVGSACALFWILTCARWFTTPMRPAWFPAVPAAYLAVPALVLAVLWLRSRWPILAGPSLPPSEPLLLVLLLAFLFRLPIVVRGAAAAVTPDGALSGIVALHIRDGVERLVFVPHVPYSGSLKSHLAAALSFADGSRARLRAFLGPLLPDLRRRGLPARPPRERAAHGAVRLALRRLRAGLRDPLQPEQRRQLRRGAGPRDVGALARRPLGDRGDRPADPGPCRRPPPRPRRSGATSWPSSTSSRWAS